MDRGENKMREAIVRPIEPTEIDMYITIINYSRKRQLAVPIENHNRFASDSYPVYTAYRPSTVARLIIFKHF